MSLFVSTETVAVAEPRPADAPGDWRPNVVHIRPKMDFGTKQRAMDALLHIGGVQGGAPTGTANLGAYNVALLVLNIVRWDGPELSGMPLSRAAIESLDPDAPLVDAVLAEITRRNPQKAADPNARRPPSALTSAGGPPSAG